MGLPAADRNKKADGLTTMDLGKVLPITATVKSGHLHIGGVDMVELAHEQGTALFVYDEVDMRSRMQSYLNAFRSRHASSEIMYASKAFLNKETARIIAEEGLGLDVAGGGELALAKAVDFPMDRVIVHGNNKSEAELEQAIEWGVGRIVVDSLIELGRVSRIAGKLGKTQDILLRITPGVEAETHAHIQTGAEDSKFGFTMRDDWAFRCVKDAINAPHVNLLGLHMHIGSQIFALDSFDQAIKVMVEFMARIKNECDYALSELDVGGGVGVAYTATDEPSSIDDFAERVVNAVKENCEAAGLGIPRIVCEPGRSLIANAGVTLYTVGTIKTIPEVRTYVAIDGGMSDNIRTALYQADYEQVVANKADQPRTDIVTLAGKHCESGDAVVIEMPIQHPEVGDIVCVFTTGAYCYSMASNYNGQPRPGIVFVRDGQARVVTRRETYDDLMARDK